MHNDIIPIGHLKSGFIFSTYIKSMSLSNPPISANLAAKLNIRPLF